jgi:hypothetical protein
MVRNTVFGEKMHASGSVIDCWSLVFFCRLEEERTLTGTYAFLGDPDPFQKVTFGDWEDS